MWCSTFVPDFKIQINPFQSSVVYYIDTSRFISEVNEITGFYSEFIIGLKKVNFFVPGGKQAPQGI